MKRLKKTFKGKKLIVFDLDGTLTPSKSDMDSEMSRLVARLIGRGPVAIIGGGRYAQFQRQFVPALKAPGPLLKNLFLFPSTATAFYKYAGGWRRVYSWDLSSKEKEKIFSAFEAVFKKIGYEHPKKTYGVVIEDRKTQVTFSALGQDVVKILGTKKGVALKDRWRKENAAIKLEIGRELQKLLPKFKVHVAGYTSIDVTRKGIDKAYGLRRIRRELGIPIREMLFVGDAIFPGGNDYAAVKTGVDWIQVTGPAETKKVIRFLIDI